MKTIILTTSLTLLTVSLALNAALYLGKIKSPYGWVVAAEGGVDYSGVDMKNPDAILAAADAYGKGR